MIASDLHADCTRCAALCCVGLAFDRSAFFGFDKPAGEPCPNLDSAFRCSIHESLAEHGFRGCVHYDCHGAGQYVTQRLFGGRSWRDEARLLGPMMSALAAIKAVHEIRMLIAAALKLALPRAERDALESFAERLSPPGGWTLAQIERGVPSELVAQVRRYLLRLKRYAAALDGHAGGG